MPTWQGSALCSGTTRADRPCLAWAVPGLTRCLHHVDDADLDLAEQIMGFRRCHRPGCLMYAVSGTDPALCKRHGANTGSIQWKLAKMRVREAELRAKHRLPPAPSPERISAALMDLEAEVGRYRPPRETGAA